MISFLHFFYILSPCLYIYIFINTYNKFISLFADNFNLVQLKSYILKVLFCYIFCVSNSLTTFYFIQQKLRSNHSFYCCGPGYHHYIIIGRGKEMQCTYYFRNGMWLRLWMVAWLRLGRLWNQPPPRISSPWTWARLPWVIMFLRPRSKYLFLHEKLLCTISQSWTQCDVINISLI